MENSTTPMESGQEFSLALPHELSEKILQYLPPQDLSRFSMCCRHYWELSNSDHLWYKICSKADEPWEQRDQNAYAFAATTPNMWLLQSHLLSELKF